MDWIGETPRPPSEIAEVYENQMELARENGRIRARNELIRRAYEMDLANQNELAELTGLSQPYICKLLNRNESESTREATQKAAD